MSFDVATFENAVIDQANETKTTPIPEGKYQALCDAVRVKSVTTKDRGDVPVLEVTHMILEPSEELKKLFEGRDKITVRQDIWLDVTPNGTLAVGPNVNLGLGRIREATGTNKPGKPFTFKSLEGLGPYNITVGFRTTDAGDVFNTITRTDKA